MEDGPFVQGRSLRSLAGMSGPFLTAYVGADAIGDGRSVAELIDRTRVEELGAEPLLATLVDSIDRHRVSGESEAVGIVVTPAQATTFDFVDPIRMPVVRVGHHPSLGPILEQHQLVAPHVVITVEDGQFGVTSFGSRAMPDEPGRSLGIASSVDAVVEQLRFAPPRLLALAGPADQLAGLDERLRSAYPSTRIARYPLADLDRSLDDLADQVVRDAATVAAEDTAHELGAYRAAAAEGLTVEGAAVIDALDIGTATAVLVHDDLTDERVWHGDRLVDAVVARAVAAGVRITMIPDVDVSRGPSGGIGAILGGRPELSALRAEPELADSVHRAEPVTRMTRPAVSR